jgi:hypothetical protein
MTTEFTTMWGDDDGTKPGFVEVEEKETNVNVLLPQQQSMGEGEGGFDLEFGFGEDDMKKRESSGES